MDDQNLERQCDEIEAVSAIYGDSWQTVDPVNRIYSVKLSAEDGKSANVTLQITLPPEYPSNSPPNYEVNAPWLKGPGRQRLLDSLDSVYLENLGEDIIFLWVEKVREFLQEFEPDEEENPPTNDTDLVDKLEHTIEQLDCPEIIHGVPIIDRKSTFQAHLACVTSPDEVNKVKQHLFANRKIANATHNILAYRIVNRNTDALSQDCDDDGEHAAGGRLLHLLQILDVKNIVVIVSRWYGGIHLGPDRFKHINNAARNIVEQAGLLSESKHLNKKNAKK